MDLTATSALSPLHLQESEWRTIEVSNMVSGVLHNDALVRVAKSMDLFYKNFDRRRLPWGCFGS